MIYINSLVLPINIIEIAVCEEVCDQWRRVVQTLDGGVHVACVAKVTQTR